MRREIKFFVLFLAIFLAAHFVPLATPRLDADASPVGAKVVTAVVEAAVEKIEDINVITGFGVMMTPALAIDGGVKVVGKVSSPEEIKQLLSYTE